MSCIRGKFYRVIVRPKFLIWRLFAEQIRPPIQNLGRRYEVLGTDGFGRSDTREQLRHFFEKILSPNATLFQGF